MSYSLFQDAGLPIVRAATWRLICQGGAEARDQSLTIPAYFPDTDLIPGFGGAEIPGLAEKFPAFALPQDCT